MVKKERIINIVLNCAIFITSFLLIINIYLNFQTSILKKEHSSFFGYSIFEIKTGSMAGNIEIGDWILVKNTKNVKLNDVITYKDKGNFITHRIIENYDNIFVTKGDSNNTKDLPITSEQVIGKVVTVLPQFGIFKNVFFNAKVLISFILVLIVFMSLFDKKTNNKRIVFSKTKNSNVDSNNVLTHEDDDDSIKIVKETFSNVTDCDEDTSKTVILSKINVNMRSNTLNELKDSLNKENLDDFDFYDDNPIFVGQLDDNKEELI